MSEIILKENLCAPIKKSEKIGEIIYRSNGVEIGKTDILCDTTAEKITLGQVFVKIIKEMSLK